MKTKYELAGLIRRIEFIAINVMYKVKNHQYREFINQFLTDCANELKFYLSFSEADSVKMLIQ